jgi:hypothetical protein
MADQPSTRRTDFGPLYLPNLIVALVASVVVASTKVVYESDLISSTGVS